MPNISEMRESKFLKQTDVGAGVLATITGCAPHNVAKEGAEPQEKWCLEFEELEKPLVLNFTNIQMCAKVCGSDNTDDWVGHQVVLYVDPNVSYGGKIVGGIRIRAPKPKAAAKPKPVPATELTDDDIPFAWVLPLVLPMTGALAAASVLV